MTPLTVKQQKFSKMSNVMNPELTAIQEKYKGKIRILRGIELSAVVVVSLDEENFFAGEKLFEHQIGISESLALFFGIVAVTVDHISELDDKTCIFALFCRFRQQLLRDSALPLTVVESRPRRRLRLDMILRTIVVHITDKSHLIIIPAVGFGGSRMSIRGCFSANGAS